VQIEGNLTLPAGADLAGAGACVTTLKGVIAERSGTVESVVATGPYIPATAGKVSMKVQARMDAAEREKAALLNAKDIKEAELKKIKLDKHVRKNDPNWKPGVRFVFLEYSFRHALRAVRPVIASPYACRPHCWFLTPSLSPVMLPCGIVLCSARRWPKAGPTRQPSEVSGASAG
jgi:hypothetical protein